MKKAILSIILFCMLVCIGCSYKTKSGEVWEFDISNMTNPLPRDGAYYSVDEAIVAKIDDKYLIAGNRGFWYDLYPDFPKEKLLKNGEFAKIEGKMAYYNDVESIFVQKIEKYTFFTFEELKKDRYIGQFNSYSEDDYAGVYYRYSNGTDYKIYKFSNGEYYIYVEDELVAQFTSYEETEAYFDE